MTPDQFKTELIGLLPRLRRFALSLTRSGPDADDLLQADAAAQEQFDDQLADPVPFALAQQIKAAPLQATALAAASARPIWATLTAAAVVFALGGLGGYALKDQTGPVVTAGWLADIADYHAVYASQGRHLVEVGADEAEHIETWLGNTIGTSFTIPDLSGFDLTFEGGRLLVANGKPVAQLMYRDAAGAVVALCMQQSNSTTTVPRHSMNGQSTGLILSHGRQATPNMW